MTLSDMLSSKSQESEGQTATEIPDSTKVVINECLL